MITSDRMKEDHQRKADHCHDVRKLQNRDRPNMIVALGYPREVAVPRGQQITSVVRGQSHLRYYPDRALRQKIGYLPRKVAVRDTEQCQRAYAQSVREVGHEGMASNVFPGCTTLVN